MTLFGQTLNPEFNWSNTNLQLWWVNSNQSKLTLNFDQSVPNPFPFHLSFFTEYEVISTTNGPDGEHVSILTTNQTHTAVENLTPESRYSLNALNSNLSI